MTLHEEYAQYVADFDPTPDYLYDNPRRPLDYEDWLDEQVPDWPGLIDKFQSLLNPNVY